MRALSAVALLTAAAPAAAGPFDDLLKTVSRPPPTSSSCSP